MIIITDHHGSVFQMLLFNLPFKAKYSTMYLDIQNTDRAFQGRNI